MGTEILEAALAYASKGIPVFPCAPRGKVPLVIKGFKDATTKPEIIRAWFSRWPAANIAIPTGELSGWAVVDIDPRHGGDVSLDRLISENGPVPDTLESLTGGGGRHLIFRWEPGFNNSAGTAKGGIAPGIDSRGLGGYIIAPPSLHESGRTYEWEGGDWSRPLAAIPDWLHPGKIKAAVLAPDGTGNLNFTVQENKPKANGQPVAPGGRNMAAASLAGQYIHEGMSIDAVLAKVKAWNAQNPIPLPDKEIERTVASIGLRHAREHPGENVKIYDYSPANQADSIGPTETGNGEAANGQAPTSSNGQSEPVIETSTAESPAPAPSPVVFPSNLLEPPGFVGELCQWINKTAYKPQPVLVLGNVLAFMGALVGRKVMTPSGLRTNLYCLGVGESGCGKEHSRQQIKRICDAAGIFDAVLGGEDASSDAAIWGTVFKMPSILFQWDEIGHMLAGANSKNAMAYQKAIVPLMMRLFSSAKTKIKGKDYAGDRDRQDIDQPNVCLYGTTVPGRLYSNITYEEVADGFLGRMLVFKSDDADPMECDVEDEPVPAELSIPIKEWWGRQTTPPPGTGNLTALGGAFPAKVPFSPGAEAAIKAFQWRCRQQRQATREKGLDPLWSRAVEHARKVALIVACGETDFGQIPTVTESTAVWAVALVEHLTASLLAEVGSNVASSDYERDLLYVRRAIENTNGDGLTHSELIHKTRRIHKRLREDILGQLLQSDDIIKFERQSPRGPRAIVYKSKSKT